MIYIGENIPNMYLGEQEATVYIGEESVYPTAIVGLKLTKVLRFVGTAGSTITKKLRVSSESDWTISTSADYVTFSQTSGEAGRYNIDVTIVNPDGADSFVINASNITGFDAQTEAYTFAENFDYLLIQGGNTFCFETDYHPTFATKLEMKFRGTNGSGDYYYAQFNCDGSDYQTFACRTPNLTSWQIGCWGGLASYTKDEADPRGYNRIILWDGGASINGIEKSYTNNHNNKPQPTINPLYIGCYGINSSTGVPFRSTLGYYGEIRISENDVVVRDYVPFVDENGVACYKELLSGNKIYMYNPAGGDTVSFGSWSPDDWS